MKTEYDLSTLQEAARQIILATKGTLEGRMKQPPVTLEEARRQTQASLEAQKKRVLAEQTNDALVQKQGRLLEKQSAGSKTDQPKESLKSSGTRIHRGLHRKTNHTK
jgi:hypothetical protein